MTRRAYLRRRARALRHGMSRSAHGSKQRYRARDTVQRLGDRRFVYGVDYAVGFNAGDTTVISTIMRMNGHLALAAVEVFHAAAKNFVEMMGSAIDGFVQGANMITAAFDGDAIDFATACGAPEELVEELRAADTVRRLTPPPGGELGLGLLFNATDLASPVLAKVALSFMTINETRGRLGLPPFPDGDRTIS